MGPEDDNDLNITNEEDFDVLDGDDSYTEDIDEQIELNEEDLRELERLGEDLIPDIFKIFMLDNGLGQTVIARTTDFSEKGLRIAVDGKHNIKPEELVVLKTFNGDLQLAGKIKYCLKTNTQTETCYFGIYLQKSDSIDEYIRLINEKKAKC